MKIWNLYIFWEGRNDNIIRFNRKLSPLDLKRIDKYLDGTHHIHGNPGKRTKKAPLRTPEEINTMITDMGKPRHTPEELDRLVEVVREENTPIKERISPVEEER